MIHLREENKRGKLPLLKRRVLQLRDVFLPECIKVQVFKHISRGRCLHDLMIRQHFEQSCG